MTLMETITNDLKQAMKENDKFSLSVYRMLKSALQLEQINAKHDLTDQEVVGVIKKQVKVRRDSVLEYQKYERSDLVENLEKEIELLAKYLPEELSDEKILEEVNKAIAVTEASTIKDMGRVMKLLTERIGTVADMSKVSALVKEILH
ncbi:MAG: GatB/YqeY domain-containing protein [Bacilli bacterium]|nr:GatB/YqeY domain-containing protein [Bacilli bacterium]